MKQTKLKIAYLNVNRFNPFLCDGVSASSLELLQFLLDQGHEAVILTYWTNEPYKQKIFNQTIRQFDPERQDKNLKSFSYMINNILVYKELFPFNQTELFENQYFISKRRIKLKQIGRT